jgi:glycosyltransferase involved in cell wall biosynthesis
MRILALTPPNKVLNGFSIAAARHTDLLATEHTIVEHGHPKKKVDAVYIHTGHAFLGCVPAHRLGLPVVGFRCVESSKANPDAAPELNELTQIWTPSTASAEALRASGTTTPVFVIPHPIAPPATPLPPRDGKPFTVLTIAAGPLIRKAPDKALQAFQQAFPIAEFPDVRWILKIRSVAPAGKKIAEDLAASDPRAILIHKDVGDVYDIYAQADVLLHLHYAGAFEMCCAEAATAGIPVITTNVGGVKDYLPPEALAPSEEITHLALNPINMAGTWQSADIGVAASRLRELYDSPAKRSELANACREKATVECAPAKVLQLMNQALALLPDTVEVSKERRDKNKENDARRRKQAQMIKNGQAPKTRRRKISPKSP